MAERGKEMWVRRGVDLGSKPVLQDRVGLNGANSAPSEVQRL